MGLYSKVDNDWKLLSIFEKQSMLEVWWGSEYACVVAIMHQPLLTRETLYNNNKIVRKLLQLFSNRSRWYIQIS